MTNHEEKKYQEFKTNHKGTKGTKKKGHKEEKKEESRRKPRGCTSRNLCIPHTLPI
jgi:hypothetical protein